jgi:hypothetical protein
MLKWVKIAYFKNIQYKLTFQGILNIWETCVEMAIISYINIHHFAMTEKLQNGEKNQWAKTSI